MDAAQMLTEREIARQCTQLARMAQQHETAVHSPSRRHLRMVDPVTEPIAVVPAEPSAPSAGDGLTERERGILAFERQSWKRPGAKERLIRELFGISASRYYQVLNALLDKPAALRDDPLLIKRLRRRRAGLGTNAAGEPEIEWH